MSILPDQPEPQSEVPLPGPELGHFTPTEWFPPENCTYDRWEHIGATLVQIHRSAQWWLGDWWRFGERAYGEAASQAAPTGYAVKTLQNAAWVADRIEPSRRRVDLTFSHHEPVAACPPDQQDAVLDLAERNRWSQRDVREEVKRRTNGAEAPSAPRWTLPEHRWKGLQETARQIDDELYRREAGPVSGLADYLPTIHQFLREVAAE